MDGSYPEKVGAWAFSTALASPQGLSLTRTDDAHAGGTMVSGPHNAHEFAQRLYAREALHPYAPGRGGDSAEPYSLEWFQHIENQRLGKHGRWIPRLLEFTKHAGETLLGMGDGLGTDWLQYARHGANVIVCSPSPSQLGLIRRNFELRGLKGRFVHARPVSLPLEAASIDVACVTNLLLGDDDPAALIDEIYRVLKPGGKVLAVAPARYDVDYWFRTIFFWTRWLVRRRRREEPVHSYTARDLKRLFGRFTEHRLHKRQLRRSEVPHIWRWLPLPLLARLMGRVLVVKAFKPLSAAMPLQAAA